MISLRHQLELRHYRYFLTVAETLHFRKAAEQLYITQPGLSRQIKQMEEALGTPLFIRNQRKVMLTPAGEFLKREASLWLGHLDRMNSQLKHIGAGDMGEVKIGFLGSAMQHVIPDLLLKLKEQTPGIHTSLEELSNVAQLNAVTQGNLDMGFVRMATVPRGIRIKTVFKDTFSLVLPLDHPVDADTFKGMQELSQEAFILFSQAYSPLYYSTVVGICEDAGFSPKVSHKSVHAQTIFKLVENNLGIAIVPTSLQHGFQMRVKFVELGDVPQRAELSVIWKEDNQNPALEPCIRLLLGED